MSIKSVIILAVGLFANSALGQKPQPLKPPMPLAPAPRLEVLSKPREPEAKTLSASTQKATDTCKPKTKSKKTKGKQIKCKPKSTNKGELK